MSVLDDIENRVNELSSSAVQKTKDASEIMGLKSCISEEEKRIKNVYSQIGELYYTKKDEAKDEINNLCQSVDEGKEKIKKWKKEILVIRKVVECPSCGHENPDSASFCLKCGTKLVKPVNDGKHCKNCGAPLMDGQLFCTRCGTKVEIVEEVPVEELVVEKPKVEEVPVEEPVKEELKVEEVPVEEPAVEELEVEEIPVEEPVTVEDVAEKPQVITNCPKCGKEIKPGQLFCTGCGTSLKDTTDKVEKVEEVKEEKVCPSCHSPIKEGQKFCVVCGERLDVAPKKIEVSKRVCPSCGLEIDGSKNKCDICGANLNEPVNQGSKCPKCGKDIKPGQLFCTGCGTKLS